VRTAQDAWTASKAAPAAAGGTVAPADMGGKAMEDKVMDPPAE